MDQPDKPWLSLAVAVVITLCLFWGSDRLADRLVEQNETKATFIKWFPSRKAESVHPADTALTVLRARDTNGNVCGYTVIITEETFRLCVAIDVDKTIYGISIDSETPLVACQDRVDKALKKAYTYIETISF